MAAIILTPTQFADIVTAFLLDKIQHPDEVIPNNEGFTEITKRMERAGLKPHLLRSYIHLDTQDRVKYKRIKKTFYGLPVNSLITITSDKEFKGKTEKEKETTIQKIKKTVRSVVKLLKAHRNRTGFPVNEETLDKIINKVMKDTLNEDNM